MKDLDERLAARGTYRILTGRIVLWAAIILAPILGVVLLQPRRSNLVLRDGTRVRLTLPGPCGTLYESTYSVTFDIMGARGEVDLRSDFDNGPVLVLSPFEDGTLYFLYDCDVTLRLIKIDTRHKAEPFRPTSALNWIIRSSSCRVEQANSNEWQAVSSSLEKMSSAEFRSHAIPSLDVVFFRAYADPKLFLPRVRKQVNAMFGGTSVFYDWQKD